MSGAPRRGERAVPSRIVRLDERDSEQVHELLRITWKDAFTGLLPDSVIASADLVWHSAETLQRQMRNKTMFFVGYREDGRLLGMARAAMADDETLRIFQIYVLSSSQRRGIGTILLKNIRDSFPRARRLVLDVQKGNESAKAFFQAKGFRFLRETTLKIGENEIQNLEGTLDL